MGKKRSRHQNPQPFLPNNDDVVVPRKRSKAPKQHQKEEKLISSTMCSKILGEALSQQKEIHDEAKEHNLVFEEQKDAAILEDEDIDEFDGFLDTRSRHDFDEEEINEDDARLLESFFSKDAGPQCTLADVIAEKLRGKDAPVSSEIQPLPKFDNAIIDLYRGVGKFLSRYTLGKMPKALKHIPSLHLWEEILYLTEPVNWSPNAMYQVTRIFASNLNVNRACRFYELVLLPRVREDIRRNKRLHFGLYQSLKKALYKPSAFFKGILLPLCESGTCNLREAVIIGSIIQKVSIPVLNSSAALKRLAGMEYRGTTSYFIKLFLDKKYALPYSVVNEVHSHFMRFLDDTRTMPVIWHQSLLTFVQRFKDALTEKDKERLRELVGKQRHKLVTPEICRELDGSCKQNDSSQTVIIKVIEKDRLDIPEVPMEED